MENEHRQLLRDFCYEVYSFASARQSLHKCLQELTVPYSRAIGELTRAVDRAYYAEVCHRAEHLAKTLHEEFGIIE